MAIKNFFIFVWCRGEVNARLKTHETIHYKQQVELLFVFQWILYAIFHIFGLLKGQDGGSAYRYNPFELEAYDNDDNENYLTERKPYAWVQYLRSK